MLNVVTSFFLITFFFTFNLNPTIVRYSLVRY